MQPEALSPAVAGKLRQTHLLSSYVAKQSHICAGSRAGIHTCELHETLAASCKGRVRLTVLVGPTCLLQICDLLCCAPQCCLCVCMCVVLSAGSAAADVLCCALRRRFIQNILFPASAAEVELKIHAITELSPVS